MSAARVEADPADLDLAWHSGDAVDVTINVVDDGGVPVDLSAFSFVAQVRRTTEALVAYPMTIDDTDSVTGTVILTMPTSENVPASGVWDLRTYIGSTIQSTLIAGSVTVSPNVSVVP